MSKASIVTYKHIARVRELLGEAAIELIKRGDKHDASKFDPEEMGPLEEMQKVVDTEGQAPYGSDEYKIRLEILKPMLYHHYALNSHHPENKPNGIDGMNLFDVVEMFFDWRAASERGEESFMNLTASKERFKISDQLFSIFENTCNDLGYKYQ